MCKSIVLNKRNVSFIDLSFQLSRISKYIYLQENKMTLHTRWFSLEKLLSSKVRCVLVLFSFQNCTKFYSFWLRNCVVWTCDATCKEIVKPNIEIDNKCSNIKFTNWKCIFVNQFLKKELVKSSMTSSKTRMWQESFYVKWNLL